jgi:hypothetical protein
MLGAWLESAHSEAWPTWLDDKSLCRLARFGEVSSRSWPVVILPK